MAVGPAADRTRPRGIFLMPSSTVSFATPDQAIAAILSLLRPVSAETLPCLEAAGRVLAELITADRDSPPCDNSAMDGYAVRLADVRPEGVAVAGEVLIGCPPPAAADGTGTADRHRRAAARRRRGGDSPRGCRGTTVEDRGSAGHRVEARPAHPPPGRKCQAVGSGARCRPSDRCRRHVGRWRRLEWRDPASIAGCALPCWSLATNYARSSRR